MALSQKVKDFIRAEFDKETDLTPRERNKEIIALVKKKFKQVIDGSDIYEICQRISKLKEKIKEVNASVEEKKLYEVVD